MKVRFTWDPKKAAANRRVHGISFETAAEVFDDPNHAVGGNYFIARQQSDVEIIHQISARKAVDYEENIYTDQYS